MRRRPQYSIQQAQLENQFIMMIRREVEAHGVEATAAKFKVQDYVVEGWNAGRPQVTGFPLNLLHRLP